ncbi:MAG: class I SAM-dependent methyltransferase, partial [Alphaproteobacteria bacterium]
MDSSERDTSANAEMIEYWNDHAGPSWVRFQKKMDGQISGIGKTTMDRAGINAGQRVLDIGCGCGDSTLELARRVGPAGAVRGIDISAPMLVLAEQRTALEPALKLKFQQLDAQTASFSSDPFAHIFSRFGVMFFDDPV